MKEWRTRGGKGVKELRTKNMTEGTKIQEVIRYRRVGAESQNMRRIKSNMRVRKKGREGE